MGKRKGVIFFESDGKPRFRPGVASNALGILIISISILWLRFRCGEIDGNLRWRVEALLYD